jgi:protocatechuate 3,4-dioxygenase beta subunit
MARIPEPRQTPDGPRYEGRALDRPDEEVVDQGLRFDVGTLVSRRNVIAFLGVGAGTLALAACSTGGGASSTDSSSSTATAPATSGATSDAEIPDETAGPYPGDGSNGPDVLADSGIVRSDIRSSIGGGTAAAGVPMALALTILDMRGGDAAFEGVAVYVWHCDAAGGYSMYSDGIESETYLRGVQVAGADGTVMYTSIVPACYSGRWPHIHFEVYPDVAAITDSANAIATSQVALPADMCNDVYVLDEYAGSTSNFEQVSLGDDNVFGDDGGASQLATVTGDAVSGYTVALTVRVDTTTTPAAGAAPGGEGGAPPSRG